MTNKQSDLTVLVNSCDLYEDAWEPFFKLFHIQWPDCQYDIVLNTETKKYKCDYISVKTICSGRNIPWSKRLRNVLNQIDSEYILFFLEDYFLLSPVKEYVLDEAIKEIKNNKRIGFISLYPDMNKAWYWKVKKNYGKYFTYLTKKSSWRINAQVTLWRKDFLLKVLRDKESAWEFEDYGTVRAKYMTQKTLCCRIDSPVAFDYHMYQTFGYGINRGKWLKKNKELFDKYNISVNFENLGWYEKKDKPPRNKRTKSEILKLIYQNPKELGTIIKNKFLQRFLFFKAFF